MLCFPWSDVKMASVCLGCLLLGFHMLVVYSKIQRFCLLAGVSWHQAELRRSTGERAVRERHGQPRKEHQLARPAADAVVICNGESRARASGVSSDAGLVMELAWLHVTLDKPASVAAATGASQ